VQKVNIDIISRIISFSVLPVSWAELYLDHSRLTFKGLNDNSKESSREI